MWVAARDVHGNGNNWDPMGFPREGKSEWLYHGNGNGGGIGTRTLFPHISACSWGLLCKYIHVSK